MEVTILALSLWNKEWPKNEGTKMAPKDDSELKYV